jgi:hypothetical protein
MTKVKKMGVKTGLSDEVKDSIIQVLATRNDTTSRARSFL